MKIFYLEKSSFAELFKLIESRPAGVMHIFRGQSNENWNLKPSLYRDKPDVLLPNLNQKEKYDFWEQSAINLFFEQGLPYLPPIERNFISDRMLAQHFGVTTCLLDWSYDPLIALFFATENWQKNTDAAFFMILTQIYRLEHPNIRIITQRHTSAIKPPVFDRRISAQKSIFTLRSYGDSKGDFIALDERDKIENPITGDPSIETDLIKIVIPSHLKRKLYEGLLQFGIDRRTLFPGLDGIGSDVAARAKAGQMFR